VLSHPPRAVFTGAVLLLMTAACGYAAGAMRQAPAQATRTVLAQKVDPAGGPGRTLALSRVTIPAHTQLGLHRHPGTQIAYVQKGTLTYTVRTGVVSVYRGAADQNPQVVRRVGAGQTGRVEAGEWVVEPPSAVHFGANRGDSPVRILLATLFKNGRPPTIPVTDDASHCAQAAHRSSVTSRAGQPAAGPHGAKVTTESQPDPGHSVIRTLLDVRIMRPSALRTRVCAR
jgi:quercetin dioxygenase-like cupin family protein